MKTRIAGIVITLIILVACAALTAYLFKAPLLPCVVSAVAGSLAITLLTSLIVAAGYVSAKKKV